MYKILKEKGNNSNITLMNVGTGTTIIIGKLSMEILSILESDGHLFNEDKPGALKLKDAWDLEVSEENAVKLAGKAMKMTKPVRQKTTEEVKKNTKKVDAMDVLLGLATYN